MAKPNYAFQKRQRELAKKQKKEAKLKQKAAAAQANAPQDDTRDDAAGEQPAAAPGESPEVPRQ